MRDITRSKRVTLGLYNSYDPTSFREAHRRVLARTGPIALGFDYNLATFGFPYPKDLGTPVEIADWVAESTSIGEGGRYLKELAGQGRFQCFDYPGKGLPPQLGVPVVTTSRPEEKKRVDVSGLADMARERWLCLLFGLGPKGLPRKVMGMGEFHLEITGKGYSLETCTALGSVAGALAYSIRSQSR